MIMNPAVSRLTGDIDGTEIRQIKLKSSRWVGFRINDLLLPEGVSVMSIQRSGNTLMPDNHTLLRENDTLTLVGSSHALKKSMRIFQSARAR